MDYFGTVIERFARKVHPDGRRLIVGSPAEVHDAYEYIWVTDEGQIDLYYPRLAPGGIIAGAHKTQYFGDDVTFFDQAWFHVKPTKGDFPFTPVILTLDRTKEAEAEMKKWGINYTLFEGVRNKKAGHIGCARSYYNIFEAHKHEDLLLVLEDDVQFVRDPYTFKDFDLPDDWDALYLGANIKGPCINDWPKFSRMTSAWTTHAILWSKKLREKVLNEFNPEKGMPIDEWLNRRMFDLKMYVCNPFYAIQRSGWSTISQANFDYITIFNSQNRLQ